MEKENVGIVIITYNVPSLLSRQIELIGKYCTDGYDIIVIDNSNVPRAIEDIKYYCNELKIEHIKIFSTEDAGSESNVFACNMAYRLLEHRFRFFLYLDHDTFPLRNFSVKDIIHGYAMAGVGQEKGKLYFQQTSLMWDNVLVDHSLIDFSYSHELGLDSGGMLYKVIEKYGKDGCVFFNEKYYQNPYFKHGMYNFYATINDDMFMHFINASGWNPIEGNDDRINSLLNILNERTNG